jgi:hypothetical protein
MRIRLLFLLSSLLFAVGQLAAQTSPTWVGARITPGLLFDATGSTYTYGNFTTTATVSPSVVLTKSGTANAYVAKFDPSGSLAWVRQLTGNVTLDQIKVSAEGVVTLAAHYQYTAQVGALLATTPANDPAQNGLLIARLDTQGTPLTLWPIIYTVKSTAANNPDSALYGWMQTKDLGQDAAGNVYLATWQRGRLLVGSTEVYGSVTTGLNQVIMKVNTQGTLEWVHQGGYLPTVAGYTITSPTLVVAPGGDVFFIWDAPCCPGDFENLVTPRAGGDLAPLIVKYTTQGVPTWIKRLTDQNYTTHSGGAITPTGDLVLGIAFRFGISFDGYTFGTPPGAALVQLASTTGVANAAVASNKYGSAFATDASGNIYLGSTLGVTCLSPSLGLRWQLRAVGSGTTGTLYPTLTDGNFLLLGNRILLSGGATYSSATLASTLTFGTTTLTFPTSGSTTTNYVAEIGGIPLAARLPAATAELACYPNPVATNGRLTLPTLPAGTQLSIADALGREVYRQLHISTSLSLPGLAPGFYVVRAQAPNGLRWLSRLEVQ